MGGIRPRGFYVLVSGALGIGIQMLQSVPLVGRGTKKKLKRSFLGESRHEWQSSVFRKRIIFVPGGMNKGRSG